MNSLMIMACTMGGMTAGFLIGAFYKREMARIDANYWKSMCELNTQHWNRMYEMERGYRQMSQKCDQSENRQLRKINAELLAACEEALEEARERDEDLGCNCWPQLLAAVAKARGTTSPLPTEPTS